MANSLTEDGGKLYKIDSVGIISKRPLWIAKLELYPSSAGDSVILKTWDENATPGSSKDQETATVTSTTTITSTGNFTDTDVSAGDIIKVTYTSTGNNEDTFSVASSGTDNAVITDGYPALTNEASKTYSWDIWTPTEFAYMKCAGTEKITQVMDWHARPRRVDNLFVDTLSSSAVLYIYLA